MKCFFRFMASSTLCGLLVFANSCGKKDNGQALLCYVGGTMRPVVEELAKQYQEKTGQAVQIDYAGSGELLIKIEQTDRGDLYVCHDPFLGALSRKGLCDKGWTAAAIEPVIVVAKGNPKNITGFKDLTRAGIKLVLTDPQYSTTGYIVRTMSDKAGITEQLEANVLTRTRGGGAAANTVEIGTSDAAIVWNAVAHLRKDKLDVVNIQPEFKLRKDVDAVTTATFGTIDMDYIRVTIASLKASKKLKAARAFAEFVVSDEMKTVWEEFGFSPADASRPHPAVQESAKSGSGELLVHCAAGMRLPIETMAEAFEKKKKLMFS